MTADPKGRGLFIVDNSVSGWTGLRYLEEWSGIAKAFDIATGYFEIGALLALDGQWQSLDNIRILMGAETTYRTRTALLDAVRAHAVQILDGSLEANKDTNPFLHGVLLPRRTPLRISTEPFAEYRETSSVGRVLPWFADGPLSASSPRRKSSGVSKAIAIWALSFTRLEANRNLLTAMSLLPKSIHRCRCYPTKFNSGRDIPAERSGALGTHPIVTLRFAC